MRQKTRKNSKQIFGKFEDRNRFYICWNCGFIIDSTKFKPQDYMGTYVEDVSIANDETGVFLHLHAQWFELWLAAFHAQFRADVDLQHGGLLADYAPDAWNVQ